MKSNRHHRHYRQDTKDCLKTANISFGSSEKLCFSAMAHAGIYVELARPAPAAPPPILDVYQKYTRSADAGVFLLSLSWRSPGYDFYTVVEHYLDQSKPMRRVFGNDKPTCASFTKAVFDSVDFPELFDGSVESLALYHQCVHSDVFGQCCLVELSPPRWTSSRDRTGRSRKRGGRARYRPRGGRRTHLKR